MQNESRNQNNNNQNKETFNPNADLNKSPKTGSSNPAENTIKNPMPAVGTAHPTEPNIGKTPDNLNTPSFGKIPSSPLNNNLPNGQPSPTGPLNQPRTPLTPNNDSKPNSEPSLPKNPTKLPEQPEKKASDNEQGQSNLPKVNQRNKNLNPSQKKTTNNDQVNKNPRPTTPKKKYSKHANGDDDNTKKENPENQENKNPAKSKGGLLKNAANKLLNRPQDDDEHGEEQEEQQQSYGSQMIQKIGAVIGRRVLLLVASGSGIFIFILLIALIIVFALFANNNGFASEDGETLCYVATKCQTIIISDGEYAGTYSLDDYIASAVVGYYKKDLFLNELWGNSAEVYKALSVIVHSDVVYYAQNDENASTCTLTENNRFQELYIPSEDTADSTEEGTDTTEDQTNNENTTDNSENYTKETITDEQIAEAIKSEARLKKYYNNTKTNLSGVRNQMTVGYSKDYDLFYPGYSSNLYGNTAASDYKKIITNYLPMDEELKKDDVENVYKICNFSDDASSDTKIYFADDVCSTVHINNGSNAGDHTIEEFIEGVVKNEVGAWSAYPELLKAQAVAARTYLAGRAKVENGTCYIDVGGNTLGYSPNANKAIKDAVAATAGEYLMRDGKRLTSADSRWDALRVIDGYTQNTSSPYYTIQQKNQKIPKAWLDPKLFNSISWYNKYSHGAGMSQYGAYYLAREEGKTYKEILKYYYDAEVAILSSKDYIMPINTFSKITGETTGRCGSGEAHKGIDFAAAIGTPIYAAHDGIVTRVYDNSKNCYPNCSSSDGVGIGFRIDHQDGTYSMYMHMSQRADLHKGDTVKAGQLIGYVGNSGSSTGPHLHFGILDATTGAVLNPRNYLPLDEKGYGRCYNY